MTTTAQATAAPAPIRIGDRDLLMSPLTDEDVGILENWARSRIRNAVMSNLDGLTPEQQQRQLDRLYDRLPNVTAWSAEGAAHISTVEGSMKSLWLSVRRNHPDVTEEWIREQLADPKAMLDAVASQSELEESQLPKFSPSAGKKKRRKRRR